MSLFEVCCIGRQRLFRVRSIHLRALVPRVEEVHAFWVVFDNIVSLK